ncbi:MAG: hypothetical protein KAR03_04095, partial [Candidatus Thorarchaeota archaeon]|nr:hypothetical protein [Candidatus Thorarchaeota archaeon]
MSEPQEIAKEDNGSIENFGRILWILGLVCGGSSILLQNGGLLSGSIITWWPEANFTPYYALISLWLIVLTIYLYSATKFYSKILSSFGFVCALLATLLWVASYPRILNNIVLSVLLFEVSALLIGVVLFTVGLVYIARQEGHRILTYATGLSFLIAGGFGIVVGYV